MYICIINANIIFFLNLAIVSIGEIRFLHFEALAVCRKSGLKQFTVKFASFRIMALAE